MSDMPRKSGIRLPWSSAGDQDASAVPSDAAKRLLEPISGAEPAPEAAAAAPAGAAAPAADPEVLPSGPSTELLKDLVSAMRTVVTASRDEVLAALRDAVDEAGSGMDAATVERQAALRSKAESDIADIGNWERAEIERVRADALTRVSQRRAALDQELAEAAARGDADQAALRAKLDAYTAELSAFMAELDRISDPAAFAAAARRMPTPPVIAAAKVPAAPASPAVPAMPAPSVATEPLHEAEPADESLPERLAELDQQLAEAERPAAEPAETSAAGDASTSIVVRGLGSFGAITSFKQALERAPGVSGLTLALGPGGEFVYNATHAPSTDMAAAVRSVEPDAEITRDGTTLQVKVTRPGAR
jgi:hypothetical protein